MLGLKGFFRTKPGFTIIELMIALVVIAILAVIGIPVFSHLIQNHKLKTASAEFIQQFRYARAEAVNQHHDIKIVFTAGSDWCYGITAKAACVCSINGDCELANINYQGHSGISLSTNNISGDEILFNGDRGIVNVSGNTVFSIASKSITINFTKLGAISICADNIGGYPEC